MHEKEAKERETKGRAIDFALDGDMERRSQRGWINRNRPPIRSSLIADSDRFVLTWIDEKHGIRHHGEGAEGS
jgi:hypothetical protein